MSHQTWFYSIFEIPQFRLEVAFVLVKISPWDCINSTKAELHGSIHGGTKFINTNGLFQKFIEFRTLHHFSSLNLLWSFFWFSYLFPLNLTMKIPKIESKILVATSGNWKFIISDYLIRWTDCRVFDRWKVCIVITSKVKYEDIHWLEWV